MEYCNTQNRGVFVKAKIVLLFLFGSLGFPVNLMNAENLANTSLPTVLLLGCLHASFG